MMTRKALSIFLLCLILTAVASPVLTVPIVAHAQFGGVEALGSAAFSALYDYYYGTKPTAGGDNTSNTNGGGQSTDNGSPVEYIINKILIWIFNTTLWLMGLAVAFFGAIFDFVAAISIAKFSALVNPSQGTSFVRAGWAIVRDVCNLFFIFILLYLAIRTILGMETDTKRSVIRVVICALLINFSFAGTSLAIDASNAVALSFYNAAKTNGSLATTVMNATRVVANSKLAGVNNVIPDIKNLTGNASEGIPNQFANKNISQIIIQGFFGMIFIVIVLIFLIAVALMLFVRMVTLVWLMVTSPWPVFNYAMRGQLTGSADDWWKSLMGQLLFAPIFFILFFIVMQMALIINGPSYVDFGLTGIGGIVANIVGNTVKYFIVIFMLFACIKYAKQMGGGHGGKIAAWAEGKINDYGKRSGAWMGRNTLGRPAAMLAETRAAKWAGSKLPGGRALYGKLDKVADAKFGGKKGFIGTTEDTIKAKAAFADRMDKDKRTGGKDQNVNKETGERFGERMQTEQRNSMAGGGILGRGKIREAVPFVGGVIRENVAAAGKVGKSDELKLNDLVKERKDKKAEIEKAKSTGADTKELENDLRDLDLSIDALKAKLGKKTEGTESTKRAIGFTSDLKPKKATGPTGTAGANAASDMKIGTPSAGPGMPGVVSAQIEPGVLTEAVREGVQAGLGQKSAADSLAKDMQAKQARQQIGLLASMARSSRSTAENIRVLDNKVGGNFREVVTSENPTRPAAVTPTPNQPPINKEKPIASAVKAPDQAPAPPPAPPNDNQTT